MSGTSEKKLVRIDVSSDTVCPWCFVGKRNLDKAIAASNDKYNFEITWHPFQLDPDAPKEGIDKREYYRKKFGSQSERMEARMSEVFRNVGLEYSLSGLTGNTIDSHRLIYFARQQGLDKQHLLVEELGIGYEKHHSVLKMAASSVEEDKYRPFLRQDIEENTKWRYGPPSYEAVNKLFEEGRTKVWAPGSLEERVQTIVKQWEMEMFHKLDFLENRSVDPEKYTFSLNGRKSINLEEKRKLGGGYIPLLQTSLPEKLRPYNPYAETADSSHKAFTTAFPRGFALEILHVYSGPPEIVYKFRHWGYMEGPFKGHAPTGDKIELYGMAIFTLDENSKVVKVEFFYDPAELLAGLLKGGEFEGSAEDAVATCPVLRNTG